jgi:hypothetical protein
VQEHAAPAVTGVTDALKDLAAAIQSGELQKNTEGSIFFFEKKKQKTFNQ